MSPKRATVALVLRKYWSVQSAISGSVGPEAGPPLGCRGDPLSMAHPLRLQLLRNQEREFQRLGRVEARVAMRVIPIGQRLLGDRLGAAGAFGDVLAGHLEMHAAGIGA